MLQMQQGVVRKGEWCESDIMGIESVVFVERVIKFCYLDEMLGEQVGQI